VEHHDSVGNLSSLLQESAAAGWEVLIVGPPPVSDAAQNQRIRDLNQGYGQSCNEAGVSYVDVFAGLLASTAWMREVRTGDGAHPADAGYGLLAALVWPHWITWIGAE
jgi:lysophospholipase L1-like esterase